MWVDDVTPGWFYMVFLIHVPRGFLQLHPQSENKDTTYTWKHLDALDDLT